MSDARRRTVALCGKPIETSSLNPYKTHKISNLNKRYLNKGSALLTVLWLSAALAAIAFSLANTVRSETDRTSTELDGLRAYYLATGAVHRAYVELLWAANMPDRRLIPQGAPFVDYVFPGGTARVEIIPETAKLDVNTIPVQDLYRIGMALGLDPERAQEVALAIDDWRRPAMEGSPFDPYYLSLIPSFRARHASLEQIEELLLVKGVTPDLFYGTYIPVADAAEGSAPRLAARAGLVDCLSVYGSKDRVDANTASPAVLAAVGLPPNAIAMLMERRRVGAINQEQLIALMQLAGAPIDRLRTEGSSVVTLRATARPRLANGQISDTRRTVAAQVRFMRPGFDPPLHILRWYDSAWAVQ